MGADALPCSIVLGASNAVRDGVSQEASMPASPSNAGPSQFDAPQFGGPQVHPEFGYFAPTVRFRRKFALVLEGLAGGVLVGAVAMFFATMEREEKAVAMLATPMLVTPMSSAATPASPKASAPTASGSAAIASTPAPAASNAAPAARATSTPPVSTPPAPTPTVSKPGPSTPASATSTAPQTAAVRDFGPVRFVPEIDRIAGNRAQAPSGPQRHITGRYGRRLCIRVRSAAGCVRS